MFLGLKTWLFTSFTLMVSIFTLGPVFTGAQLPPGPFPCLETYHQDRSRRAQPCPHDNDIEDPCNGPWSVWGKCNDQCIQSRARLNPIFCPLNNAQTRACSPSMCCDPYQMTPWTPWGSCSVKCGYGTKMRSRDVAQTGTCVPCPATTQSVSCGNNCQVSSWSAWGACSKRCGTGEQTRVRHIIKTNGCTCPICQETRKCNTQCCRYCKTCKGWWPFRSCRTQCCSIPNTLGPSTTTRQRLNTNTGRRTLEP